MKNWYRLPFCLLVWLTESTSVWALFIWLNRGIFGLFRSGGNMNFPFLRKQLLLLFCFFMQGAYLLFAQVLSPLFHQYSTEEGLASSEVYDVLEDASGIMWFGTDKGLARFDGYEFKTYTSKDGLTDNTVFNLRGDHRGRVWMQTYSGKLFYFEAGKIQPRCR